MVEPVPLLSVALGGLGLCGVGVLVAVGRYLDPLAPTLVAVGVVILVAGAVPGIALAIRRDAMA